MKLTTIEASSPRLPTKLIIFGGPKTGKSEAVGKLAEKFNLHWFDLENGFETLLKLPTEWKERINLYQIPDTRSFPVAIQTMLKVIKGGKHTICYKHGVVGCPKCAVAFKGQEVSEYANTFSVDDLGYDDILVVDSLTQLTSSAIAHITKDKPDDYKLEFDDWGNLGKLMDIFLSHVQQSPFHVACISHESEVILEDKKKRIVPVSGTTNFSRNTAKYFGHVVYSSVNNKKHTFGSATDYAMNIVTGSRTDVAIENLEVASLIPFFDKSVKIPEAKAAVNSQGQAALSGLAAKYKSGMLGGGK